MGLPDRLPFRALWDMAREEHRRGAADAAFEIWLDLAQSRNPYRGRALLKLAKRYERREKNYATALEVTLQASAVHEHPGLRRRQARLRKRLSR